MLTRLSEVDTDFAEIDRIIFSTNPFTGSIRFSSPRPMFSVHCIQIRIGVGNGSGSEKLPGVVYSWSINVLICNLVFIESNVFLYYILGDLVLNMQTLLSSNFLLRARTKWTNGTQ